MYESEDGEADLLLAASYLLVYLAKNHCFQDGNKRAAWIAMIRALDANGFRVAANEVDAAKLVDDVAQKILDVHDVLVWLTVPGRIVAAPGWE
jgi:death on curing protein